MQTASNTVTDTVNTFNTDDMLPDIVVKVDETEFVVGRTMVSGAERVSDKYAAAEAARAWSAKLKYERFVNGANRTAIKYEQAFGLDEGTAQRMPIYDFDTDENWRTLVGVARNSKGMNLKNRIGTINLAQLFGKNQTKTESEKIIDAGF